MKRTRNQRPYRASRQRQHLSPYQPTESDSELHALQLGEPGLDELSRPVLVVDDEGA